MVERAMALAAERESTMCDFRSPISASFPFPESSFDALFTSAVLEPLSNSGQALLEMYRVPKPGGCVGIINTDRGEPLISPPDESVRQFFERLESGFNHHGGSFNRGRHLRRMMRQAGFTVIDFSTSFNNAASSETVQRVVAGYMA
jgi:ubiquinone/menaquinone biosynthesis C-methylase UbiE